MCLANFYNLCMHSKIAEIYIWVHRIALLLVDTVGARGHPQLTKNIFQKEKSNDIQLICEENTPKNLPRSASHLNTSIEPNPQVKILDLSQITLKLKNNT